MDPLRGLGQSAYGADFEALFNDLYQMAEPKMLARVPDILDMAKTYGVQHAKELTDTFVPLIEEATAQKQADLRMQVITLAVLEAALIIGGVWYVTKRM
jgi:hypothetical protein